MQELRRAKNVGLEYHYVRQHMYAGDVEVFYTPSAENRADSFTKILGKEMHAIHVPFILGD